MSVSLPDKVVRGSPESFLILLGHADNIDEQDAEGRTAVYRAARIGRTRQLEALLTRGANANIFTNTGESPLHAATKYGHLDCMKLLVAFNADVNSLPPPDLTEYSETALCTAVRRFPAAVQYLLSHSANPNLASEQRRLPLVWAICMNDLVTAEILLKNGANVNARAVHDYTPLHHAVQKGNPAMVKLMIYHGAKLELTDDRGETPLFCLCDSEVPNRVEVLHELICASVDLEQISPYWEMTITELAQDMKLKTLFDALLKAGALPPRKENADDRQEVFINIHDLHEDLTDELDDQENIEPLIKLHVSRRLTKEQLSSRLRDKGWAVSAGHWYMLEKCRTPITIERMAYYARGFRNAPKGAELNDGPEFLGETYREALTRFCEMGLIAPLSVLEIINKQATAEDFKVIAQRHGIKVSGNKNMLLGRILEFYPPEQLYEILKLRPIYQLTKAGKEFIAAKRPDRSSLPRPGYDFET